MEYVFKELKFVLSDHHLWEFFENPALAERKRPGRNEVF